MTRRASEAGMFAATRAIFPFSTATSSAPRRFCAGSITLPPFSTRSYMASLLRSACRWRESTRVRATRSSHHEHDGEDHQEEPGRELDQPQRRPNLADRTARLQDPSLKDRRPLDRERGDEHDGQRQEHEQPGLFGWWLPGQEPAQDEQRVPYDGQRDDEAPAHRDPPLRRCSGGGAAGTNPTWRIRSIRRAG